MADFLSRILADPQDDARLHRRLLQNEPQHQTIQQHQQQQPQNNPCSVFKTLNTGLDEVADVPPLVGIMFVVAATTNVDIVSLDVDVRLSKVVDERNVSDVVETETEPYVEVYMLPGDFQHQQHQGDPLHYPNDPNQWTRVFAGVGVLQSQNHGLILPARDFVPISLEAHTRTSLYITMNTTVGPYLLDYKVNALEKTGEFMTTTARGGELNVLVGAGLSQPNFPETIDPIVDPQFAGVIHYQKAATTGNCGHQLLTSTTADYYFTFASSRGLDDSTLQAAINQAMDEVLRDYLASDSNAVLQTFQNNNQLALQGYPTTYTLQNTAVTAGAAKADDECPTDMMSCILYSAQTSVTFRHDEQLSAARLLNELYNRDMTTLFLANALQGRLSTSVLRSVHYTGLNSIKAEFSMTLEGVGSAAKMDLTQQEYFVQATESFLQNMVDPRLASNFEVVIETQHSFQQQQQQTPLHHLRALRGQGTLEHNISIHKQNAKTNVLNRDSNIDDGVDDNNNNNITLKVSGYIRASRLVSLPASELDNTLDEAFLWHAQAYREMLAAAGLRPGPILQDQKYEYFTGISHVKSWVQEIASEVAASASANVGEGVVQPLDGPNRILIASLLGCVGGAIFLLTGTYFLRKYFRERAAYEAHLVEYRKQRRANDKRQRRHDFYRKLMKDAAAYKQSKNQQTLSSSGEEDTSSSFSEHVESS